MLILHKGPTQGLDNTKLTAEAEYSICFTTQRKRFCLTLYYNGRNSDLSVNEVKIYQFKAKDSAKIDYPVCFGNISKGWWYEPNLNKWACMI